MPDVMRIGPLVARLNAALEEAVRVAPLRAANRVLVPDLLAGKVDDQSPIATEPEQETAEAVTPRIAVEDAVEVIETINLGASQHAESTPDDELCPICLHYTTDLTPYRESRMCTDCRTLLRGF